MVAPILVGSPQVCRTSKTCPHSTKTEDKVPTENPNVADLAYQHLLAYGGDVQQRGGTSGSQWSVEIICLDCRTHAQKGDASNQSSRGSSSHRDDEAHLDTCTLTSTCLKHRMNNESCWGTPRQGLGVQILGVKLQKGNMRVRYARTSRNK